MADIQIIMEVLGKDDVLKAAKATDKLERDVRALNKRFKEGSISQSDYMRGMNQLASKNKQVGGGYKNLQRAVFSYAKQVDRAQKENTEFAQSANQAANAQDRLASSAGRGSNQFASYNTATYKANQQTKRFASVGLQQAGYQVGDFAIQMQGGTNAAVAFGQQGSQLLGIFGAWGAVLGAGLAIGTAIVAPLIDAKKAAEDFETSLDSMSTAISSTKQALDLHKMGVVELIEKYGLLAFEARQASVEIAKADYRGALSDLRDFSIPVLEDMVDAMNLYNQTELFSSESNRASEQLREIRDELQLSASEFNDLKDSYTQFQEASTLSQQVEAAIDLRDVFSRIPEEVLQSDAELNKMVGSLSKLFLRGSELEDLMSDLENSVPGSNWMDSAITGVNGLINRVIGGINRVRNLGDATDDTADAAKSLTGNLSNAKNEAISLRDALNSIDLAGLEQAGQVSVLRAKISAAGRFAPGSDVQSAEIARSEAQARVSQELSGTGASVDTITEKAREAGQRAAEIARLRQQLSSATTAPGSSGGGGGASGPTQAEVFNKSSESLTNLIAKYDEGVAEAKKLRDAQVTVNDAVANGVITQQQGTQVMQDFIASLDQAEGPLQKIGNTMKDAFGNALMSIVDGTKSAKDAFKDMARAVLKQAYELLVIKPLMDSLFGQSGDGGIVGSFLSGLTGQANGGAWNNGVQMYANGGVVGSPTAFQHKGGLGVMGEAGPEAIMPLKRGKNGKLGVQSEGGSGDVNVTQVFNINGNGDEYILQKIKQQAPKIANYAQQQILDQRRRGGAMKSTFGG